MHLIAIAETARGFINNQRIIFPGIPMAEHDFHKFISAVIAPVMFHHFVMAHIGRFAIIQGCHDIPGRAPRTHQIQSLHGARHMEGLVISGGGSGTQAKA